MNDGNGDKKAMAYRAGVITFVILLVLTGIEYVAAVSLSSIVILFVVALVKAAFIVQNYMHISRLWQEESH